MFAVSIGKIGDISSVKLVSIANPAQMKSTDVFIQHHAFGINQEDIAIAMGQYPFAYYKKQLNQSIPILGLEASGSIIKTGSNVKNLHPGQRVIYSLGSIGAYCEKRILHHTFVRPIPDSISHETAAACSRKCLMIHSLLFKTISIQKGSIIMVHNAADNLEAMLCQWAAQLNLTVIGTITSESDREAAELANCTKVINRTTEPVIGIVEEFTKGRGVRIVYDSVGKGVEKISLSCLEPFGAYVHYNNKAGYPEINTIDLLPKSLFFTVPSLELYKGNQIEMAAGMEAIFKALSKGYIKPSVNSLPIKSISTVMQNESKRNSHHCIALTA